MSGHWGPTTQPPPKTPRAGRIALIGIGALFAMAAVGAALGPRDSEDPGPALAARAGWTPQRAADLLVGLERDGGYSRTRANCAMRAVVGSATWLEWRALTRAGQLAVINSTPC